MNSSKFTVDAVIVTYNRLEKLRNALSCYEKQTVPLRTLIIVDNCSSDGTKDFLDSWSILSHPFSVKIIHMDSNTGGSGGFYAGQKYALTLKPDWLFLGDDDAYPDSKMMESFNTYAINNDISRFSAICGTVYHSDGTIDFNHRSRVTIQKHRFYHRYPSTINDYKKDYFEIDFLSYVGAFINVKALNKVGLVNPDLFIFYDDTEHSLRLKKYGKIICVPSIKIVHDDINPLQSQSERPAINWKDYYFERNETVMLKKHFPLVALHQLRIFLKKKRRGEYNTVFGRIKIAAMHDAWRGHLGVHPIYKPGWQVKY